MEYCFPLCVSIAFVFNHSSRCFENGMIRLKLDGSFPAGYRFGNRSGTCTKLNGLVKPFSNPRTAGVLTVSPSVVVQPLLIGSQEQLGMLDFIRKFP